MKTAQLIYLDDIELLITHITLEMEKDPTITPEYKEHIYKFTDRLEDYIERKINKIVMRDLRAMPTGVGYFPKESGGAQEHHTAVKE